MHQTHREPRLVLDGHFEPSSRRIGLPSVWYTSGKGVVEHDSDYGLAVRDLQRSFRQARKPEPGILRVRVHGQIEQSWPTGPNRA